MDTDSSPSIHVHVNDETVLKFKEYSSGVYYYDTMDNHSSENVLKSYCMLNTVNDNKKIYQEGNQ